MAFVHAGIGVAVSQDVAVAHGAQLTGSQLSAVLLPEQDFPGYTIDEKNSTDSGTTVYTNSQWTLTGMDCASFEENFAAAGFGETGYAQRLFATPNMTEVVNGITVNLAPVDLVAMHGVDVCEVTYSGDGPPATHSLASVAQRLSTRLSA